MNGIQEFSSGPWVQRLGWTLFHFLWQGTAIAVFYMIARFLFARALSPRARYSLACTTLLAMAVAPPLTYLTISSGGTVPSQAAFWSLSPAQWKWFPAAFVSFWVAGVFGFSIRLFAAFRFSHRLRTTSRLAPPEWQQTLQQVAARMGRPLFAGGRSARLMVSSLVNVPAIIGYLQPLILVPAAALTGLPTEHILALLAHEMAHIRRNDYIAGVLQSLAEVALFYHPAVWWISGQIRAERELCCDDLVIAAGTDVLTYARALTELESRRPARLKPQLAADGGSLAERIRRLIDPAHIGAHCLPRAGSAFAMILLWFVGAGVLAVAGPQKPTGEPRAARLTTAPQPAAIQTDAVTALPDTVSALASHARNTLLFDPLLTAQLTQPPPPGAKARPSAGASTPAFDIADIHASPRSDWVHDVNHRMQGGFLAGDRYAIHRATMLDLIRTAYNVDADKIFGGPSWIDYDRFEVTAKTKPGTRPATLHLMLRTLLAGRFHVVVKMDTQPVPGYVLSKSKGDLKFKAATGSASNGCQIANRLNDGVMTNAFQCRNMTMDEFASFLHGLVSQPVLNSTDLDGMWDVDFQYASGPNATGGNNAVDAVAGLGLKLEQGKVPQPVLNVVSANELPSPNPPGVAQALPPLPPPEFEVASMRICSPNDGGGSSAARFEPGGRVTANCSPPGTLVQQAWGLRPFQLPPGLPKSFAGTVAFNVSIVAKAPEGVSPDSDTLNAMLRTLLTDRYQMKVHYEDRPMDAHTLVAVKPKLTKADPASRTGCTRQNEQGPGVTSTLHLVCRNMTMAQFAEQIRGYNSEILYPVADGTGIDGAWNFTIEYDPLAGLAARGFRIGGPAAPPADGQAPDPSGSLSFADAIQKQLGLKLEVHKRAEPVLVIDHMEEKPSDN